MRRSLTSVSGSQPVSKASFYFPKQLPQHQHSFCDRDTLLATGKI